MINVMIYFLVIMKYLMRNVVRPALIVLGVLYLLSWYIHEANISVPWINMQTLFVIIFICFMTNVFNVRYKSLKRQLSTAREVAKGLSDKTLVQVFYRLWLIL